MLRWYKLTHWWYMHSIVKLIRYSRLNCLAELFNILLLELLIIFVRLYPTATCSCPAKTECYHVCAAQVAIGIRGEIEPKKHLSLTQLCKNKRKRADKTSGRKKPRVDDVDVEPPSNKTKARLVTWVQCDSCDMWYHNVCVGLKSKIPDTNVHHVDFRFFFHYTCCNLMNYIKCYIFLWYFSSLNLL